MGKLDPLGKLSGAVGPVVFVQLNGKTFARSKPHKVKQTSATRKAASAFGWLSSQERKFREVLFQTYDILSDKTVAYRHRSLLNSVLIKIPAPKNSFTTSLMQSDFRLLQGFDFNKELLWKSCFLSFIEVTPIENQGLQVCIPSLEKGVSIKYPARTDRATLTLKAFSTNLDTESTVITPISELKVSLYKSKTSEKEDWFIDTPATNEVVFLLGQIEFHDEIKKTATNQADLLKKTSTSYLWCSKTGE